MARSLFPLFLQGRGTKDPTETLEELYSLLLLTGHILADEGEGEIPLVLIYFFRLATIVFAIFLLETMLGISTYLSVLKFK